MNNNPFDDKINKAVAEAAKKVIEQSVAEAKEKEQEDRPDVPFAGPYRDATKPAKDKFGNVIKNRARSLARQGMAGVRKEEVEQMDELKKSTLVSYVGKARENLKKTVSKNRALAQNRSTADVVKGSKQSDKRNMGIDRAYDKLNKEEAQQVAERLTGKQHKIDANKNGKVDAHDFKLLRKEEVIDEAMINGREYASHGLMHPTHAREYAVHKVTGNTVDFYAHGSGDKVSGKVTKNDGKAVHIKDTSGKTHRFEVSTNLSINKLTVPDRKYIKGTPENKALKAARKPINGMPTNVKEEAQQVAERLTGKQHKIDANKNGKVDAHDFKLLRSKTKKMMKESIQTLMEDTTPALSAAMKAILADAFHMYFKAHTFHWNVEGANFPEYHKFFGDVYEQLFETIDPIAEEIRALGDYAPRSLTELKGSTSIDDSSVQTPAEMFASLLGDNNKIIAGMTNGYSVAEASGEIGLSNFLQDKIDAHKKLSWMIKSTAKGA